MQAVGVHLVYENPTAYNIILAQNKLLCQENRMKPLRLPLYLLSVGNLGGSLPLWSSVYIAVEESLGRLLFW